MAILRDREAFDDVNIRQFGAGGERLQTPRPSPFSSSLYRGTRMPLEGWHVRLITVVCYGYE